MFCLLFNGLCSELSEVCQLISSKFLRWTWPKKCTKFESFYFQSNVNAVFAKYSSRWAIQILFYFEKRPNFRNFWILKREASTLTITPPMNPRSTRLEASTPNHYTTNEPTIYQTRDEHANYYTTDEPTIYQTRDDHANHYTTDGPTIYQTRDEHA